MTVNQATTHLLWNEFNPKAVRNYIECCLRTVFGEAYFQDFTFEILERDFRNFCQEHKEKVNA